jgi:hypothetical protein
MITIFISWIKNFFFKWKKTDDNNYKIVVVEPLINNSYKKNYSGIFITEHDHAADRDSLLDDEHDYFLNDIEPIH